MAGKQHFLIAFALNSILAVRQVTIFKTRIDDNFVFSIFQAIQLFLTEAKPSNVYVIGRTIGDPFRMGWQRVQMIL